MPLVSQTLSRVLALCLTLAAITTVDAARAQEAPEPKTFNTSAGAVEVTREAGPFEHPWSVAFLPDGRQLVTERPGRLNLVAFGKTVPVAGAPKVVARGQGGLFDVVVSPNFQRDQTIFFSFAAPAQAGARTAVARAKLQLDGRPRLTDLQTIWRQHPALSGGRHFGGRIVVDGDGALFVTTGDRGRRELAQDLDNHIGKVIRIRPTGGAAPDNPFASRGDAKPEIWSYGHRNIQGATLSSDGALWTVEHGAAGGDEINRPRAGKNYGWPEISYGRHYSGAKIGVGVSAPGMQQPEFYWDPSIAPSGLAIYEGDLFPDWKGDLLVGALKYQLISRLDLDGDRIVGEERILEDEYGRVRDVRAGPDGAIWFLTDEPDGGLYRIAPVGR